MNGTKSGKPFPPGVHVPSLTWFLDDSNQEIDWDTQRKHLSFLIKSGLHGSTLNRVLLVFLPDMAKQLSLRGRMEKL